MRAVRLPYFRINPRSEKVVGDGITELRVHGVNGAAPEQMLHDPHPLFVTGDNAAAFYRRRPELGTNEPGGAAAQTVEAYSWNGLNSRSSTRAFWLLLFPFALTNFAAWLLPTSWSDTKSRVARMLIRLIGLSLTIEAALVVAIMSVDLIGFQCGTSATCRSLGWLGWFTAIHTRTGSLVQTVLVMSVVPLLVVAGLWLAGQRSALRYDRYWRGGGLMTAISREGEDVRPTRLDDLPLRSPAFWQAPKPVATQALLHIGGTVAALGWVLLVALDHLTGRDPPRWQIAAFGILLAGVVFAIAGIGWWYRAATGRSETASHYLALSIFGAALALTVVVFWQGWSLPLTTEGDPGPLRGPREAVQVLLLGQLLLVSLLTFLFPRVLIGSALTAVAGLIAFNAEPQWSWWAPLAVGSLVLAIGRTVYPRWAESTSADVAEQGTFWLIAALALAAIASLMSALSANATGWTRAGAVGFLITWLVLFLHRQIKAGHDLPPSWSLRNGAPAAMVGIACVVAAVISASGTIFLAERLGPARSVQPGDHLQGAFAYPLEFEWISAMAFGGLIVFVLALTIRAGCLWVFRWRPLIGAVSDTYTLPDPDPGVIDIQDPSERNKFAIRATRARWLAALVDDADWLLFAAMAAMLAAAYALTWTIWVGDDAADLSGFVEIAVSGLTAVALGSVWLVQRSRADAGVRKLTGILWEVISFFPRRYHPLSPPCYAERSVPELRSRLVELTEPGNAALILAHSEGTLISTAALLSMLDDGSLSDRLGNNLRFVTYGCMLRRLFGRAFPSHLLEADLAELKARLEGADPNERHEFPAEPRTPPGWMNFARPTDFLGGRLFTELASPDDDGTVDRPDDVMFGDPTRRWRFRGETHDARMWRHSFDYVDPDEDPRFAAHVAATIGDFET